MPESLPCVYGTVLEGQPCLEPAVAAVHFHAYSEQTACAHHADVAERDGFPVSRLADTEPKAAPAKKAAAKKAAKK